MAEENGWIEYKRLVLKQLEDLTAEVKEVNVKLDKQKIDLLIIKTKAGTYGAIGGFIISTVVAIIVAIIKI